MLSTAIWKGFYLVYFSAKSCHFVVVVALGCNQGYITVMVCTLFSVAADKVELGALRHWGT